MVFTDLSIQFHYWSVSWKVCLFGAEAFEKCGDKQYIDLNYDTRNLCTHFKICQYDKRKSWSS